MTDYMLTLIGLSLVVGIVSWLTPTRRDTLPPPDKSTLRRPLVDKHWWVSAGRTRQERIERRYSDRRSA